MTTKEMIEKLEQYYIPIIEDDVLGVLPPSKVLGGGCKVSCKVKFIEQMDRVNGIMFELIVKLHGKVFSEDLAKVVSVLDGWCTADENQCRMELNGYKFLLGDGDDGGAVWFADGAFHIWLRGWKE